MMSALTRWIFIAGIGLIVLAALLWIMDRFGLTIGSLPGDIRIQRGATSIFIPIASSLLLSALLTLLFNVVLRSKLK